MNKKIFATLSLILIASMFLTACGSAATQAPVAPAAPADTAATAAPAAADTAAPAAAASTEGKYLTVNVEQVSTWLRNFNPFSPDVRYPAQTAMYEPLMVFNKNTNELIPWLATAYKWNDDNTELTFTIRQGVLWSDGQPFSASDVIFTFDLLKKFPALATTATSILNDYVDTVTAPDASTVLIKFKKVYTPALYDLSNQYIVPEHIWKDVTDPVTYTNENPVGTGPFTEVTRFDDQIYVVEKNPHYWQPGKPYFQGLKYPAYPGNDQANMALTNGDLDWAGNFVPDIDNTYVAKDPANFHYYFGEGDTILLYINPALKPFDDPAVRKAVSMGIDRKMVVDTAEYGYIQPSDVTGISAEYASWKTVQVSDEDNWTAYNPEKANAALDALGLKKGADGIRLDKDGKPMKYILIAVAGWTDWVSACQVIAQNMKDLGITITVETPEFNAWMDELGKGQHQWAISYSSGGPTPLNFYRGLMSKSTMLPVGEASDENWNRIADPEADALMDDFVKTSDAAQQKEIMTKIQTLFIKDAPALPLFPGPDWYEYSTRNFTDWPTKENNYAPGTPYASPAGSMSPLIMLTTIKPK